MIICGDTVTSSGHHEALSLCPAGAIDNIGLNKKIRIIYDGLSMPVGNIFKISSPAHSKLISDFALQLSDVPLF